MTPQATKSGLGQPQSVLSTKSFQRWRVIITRVNAAWQPGDGSETFVIATFDNKKEISTLNPKE